MQPCTENVRGLHDGQVRLGLQYRPFFPAKLRQSYGGASVLVLLCGVALHVTLCFLLWKRALEDVLTVVSYVSYSILYG